MANAERDFIVEKVKEVIAAPSCCKELKDVAQKYLDALDTADEMAAGRLLIAELEEDVQSLDDTIVTGQCLKSRYAFMPCGLERRKG